jgi:signal peptidase I
MASKTKAQQGARRTTSPASARDRSRSRQQNIGWVHWAWEWTKSIGGAVLLFLVIRTFLIQTFVITSGSMENTLLVGDFLVLNKAAYGAEIPWIHKRMPGYAHFQRGDIIVFRARHAPNLDLVKRLTGLPGDTLSMRDAVLYIDGVPQKEPYVRHSNPEVDGYHPWMVWQKQYLEPGIDPRTYHPTLNNWGPIIVPPGHLFALGDNRDMSLDSRYWGFVDETKVKGRVLGIYFSYDPDAPDVVPWLQDIRWNRIFTRVR